MKMVLTYGVIFAVLGFLIGFIRVVFAPDPSEGSFLGVFVSGPVGFLLGIIIGAVFRSVQKQKPEFKHPLHNLF